MVYHSLIVSRKIAECGTRSGMNRHYRLKQPLCDLCKKCAREHAKKRYQNQSKEVRKLNNAKMHLSKKQKAEEDEMYALRLQEIRKKINDKRWLSADFRELSRQQRFKRRARKAGVLHEPYTEQDVINLYGNICHICGKDIDLNAPRKAGIQGWENGLHLDHVIPIAKGGDDILNNVKPAHGKCNILKGAN